MSEILFRGKSIRNNAWVYGGYHKHQLITPCPITPNGENPQEIKYTSLIIQSGFSDWNLPKPLKFYEVAPETVGQYAGLTDKNGKKIYEGDIIDVWRDGLKRRFVVKWRESGVPMYILYPQPLNEDFWHCRSDMDMSWEIIGNIYDNPELLGGDEE